MRACWKTVIAAVLAAFLAGGCATNSVPGGADDEDPQSGIEELLDKAVGKIEGDPASRPYREARLLRGQLIAGIVARYGVARIEDFSADRKADATKLLGLIEVTEGAMLKGKKVVQDNNAFFNVYRTDILFAVVDMAAAALAPTARGVRLFVVSTSPLERVRLGRQLLRNILEDKLYQDAYFKDFAVVLQRVKTQGGKTSNTDWQEVSQHLTDACVRLYRIVGKTGDCVPADLKKAL